MEIYRVLRRTASTAHVRILMLTARSPRMTAWLVSRLALITISGAVQCCGTHGPRAGAARSDSAPRRSTASPPSAGWWRSTSTNTTACFRIRRFGDRRRTRCTFMKRRVNYPYVSIGSLFLLDTRPFIAHGPVSAGTSKSIARRQALASQKRGGSHFYTRSIRGTSGAGARDDSREEQRFLRHGSHTRPGTSTRLLLQLDDRVGPTLYSRRLCAGHWRCVRIVAGW